MLGAACGGRGDAVSAATWFRRVLYLDAASVDGVVNLGFACLHARRWEEALRWMRRSIALVPSHPLAHYNRGVAALHLGRFPDTVQASARARIIDPSHRDAPYNEALSRLALGDWRRGFALYERRWDAPSFPIRWRPPPGRRWDGRPAPGKTLLLLAEQGHGDSIQFIRYAALAAPLVGRIVVAAPPALLRLLGTARGVERTVDARNVPTDIDLYLPLLSLPLAFGTEPGTVPADIPYLDLDRARIDGIPNPLSPDPPKVGLCWRGNPAFADDFSRSPGISVMESVLATPGIQFVSLVKERRAGETEGLGLLDPMDQMHDFFDTARLIQSLDLVITSDTAVAHLAGALGRPTWVLLSAAADWRWLTQGTRSPWYPTMTLFRQSALGRWDEARDRVGAALAAWRQEWTPA